MSTSIAQPPAIGWIDLLNGTLRQRRVAAVSALAVMIAATAFLLARPDTYSASTTFVPGASTAGGQLAGFAAEFGLSLPNGDQTRSPGFYADLLRSRRILEAAAQQVVLTRDGSRRPVSELLEIDPDPQDRKLQRTRSALAERLAVSVALEIGTVTFSVKMPDPEASREVVAAMLDEVRRFDTESRQTQAAAQRDFAADRLRDLEAELSSRENELENFLLANRDFTNSPTLRFEHDRLQRQVLMLQQNVTAIRNAFEQARIEAVRDIPRITVIDAPAVPVKADPKYTIPLLIVAAILSILAGIAIAICVDFIRGANSTDPRMAEFRRLRSEITSEVRALIPQWTRRRNPSP